MASARAIEAGRAVLRVLAIDEGVAGVLDGVYQKVEGTAKSIRNVGVALAATGAGALGALALPIREAANAQEIAGKFQQVFGEATDGVRQFAAVTSSELGRSQIQLQEFLASFQDLLQPVGFDAGPARQFSEQLTTLAVDLASFNNQTDASVVRDLQAALTGSSEVMKKYGVIVNEAAVKTELLNRELDPKNASEVEKVQARLAIIMRSTTAAQGDAARTAGSFTNQMKALAGQVQDAAAAVGAALLPIVTPVVTAFKVLATAVGNVATRFPLLVQAGAALAVVVSVVGGAIAALSVGLGIALGPMSLAGAAATLMGISLRQLAVSAASAAVSMGGLSLATTALTAVVRVAAVTLQGLLFNPVVVGIVAVTTVLAGLAIAFGGLEAPIRSANNELRTFTELLNEASSLDTAVNRLEALANAGELSTRQLAEANRLLNTLSQTQDVTGIAVDGVTKKVIAQSGAFDGLRKSIVGATAAGVKSNLEAERNLVKQLGDERLEIARKLERLENATSGRTRLQTIEQYRDRLAAINQEIAAADARIAAANTNLASLPQFGGGTGGPALTDEQLREQQRLNKQFAQELRDSEIRAIEDSRARQIAQAEEQANRKREIARAAAVDTANIEAQLASEIARINRDADTRVAEQKQRELERTTQNRRQFEEQASQGLRDAQIAAIEDPRERALAELAEQERREIESAEKVGASKADIHRKYAIEKETINKQFDARDKLAAEREAKKNESLEKRKVAQQSVSGALASRAAAQQFGGGRTEQFQDQSLRTQKGMLDALVRIERKPGGLQAV